MKKIILDLCGGSGSWSRPYRTAGYDVRLITLPDYDVLDYEPPEGVHGILAAPPCTEFSILNCRAEARERKPHEGLKVVMACLRIIEKARPAWWAMENPVGHLREYMGPPALTFQPWQYGDPWTKRTDLWRDLLAAADYLRSVGGRTKQAPALHKARERKPNFAYLHKAALAAIPQLAWVSPKTDADFRAITPPGFAQAFFRSNP